MRKEENRYKELIKEALKAREKSYSPYSGFAVGAALLCKSQKIYTGCNIESAAFGPSICAERVAFFNAVSDGIYDFEAIAIVGGPKKLNVSEYCFPCGVCRQVMSEFCPGLEFKIIVCKSRDIDVENIKIYTLSELLPHSFGLKNIED